MEPLIPVLGPYPKQFLAFLNNFYLNDMILWIEHCSHDALSSVAKRRSSPDSLAASNSTLESTEFNVSLQLLYLPKLCLNLVTMIYPSTLIA